MRLFRNNILNLGMALLLAFASAIPSAEAQTDADALHFWSDRSCFTPAFVQPMFHASLTGRRQQIGFRGEPYSVVGDVSNYYAKLHSLFGAQLRYDYAGYTTTGRADLRYAFNVGSDYDRLNFGLQGGIAFINYDETKIKADNTNDAYLFDNNNRTDCNFNLGIEWVHKVTRLTEDQDEFSLGASILNMEDLFNWSYRERLFVNSVYGYTSYRYRTMRAMDIYGGLMAQFYDTNRLHGELHAAVIKTNHDDGSLETYDQWAMGATYRHNFRGVGSSDLIFNAGIAASRHLYFGLGYDVVLGNHTNKAFSSVEVFVEYKFKNRHCLTKRSNYDLLGGK